MKGTIKANTTDRYLEPIRWQIVEMIDHQSTVVEFGCGNGDLLFKLADKIQEGTGIDHSEALVTYARKQQATEGIQHLNFEVMDLTQSFVSGQHVDYSVASLLLHVLPWNVAADLLKSMLDISDTVIICGFCQPQNWKHHMLLYLDQRFSGHYGHFKVFKEKGYTEGLIRSVEGAHFDIYSTFDPVIKIYRIGKGNS